MRARPAVYRNNYGYFFAYLPTPKGGRVDSLRYS